MKFKEAWFYFAAQDGPELLVPACNLAMQEVMAENT